MTQDEGRARLDEFRVRIDDVDRRIVELLNDRTRVVEDIGRVKREAQLPIYEPKREEQVYANIVQSNHGPLDGGALRRIFERVIDEMRQIQRLRMEFASKEEMESAAGASQEEAPGAKEEAR